MITKEEYLKDPCGASSLSYWKTQNVVVPGDIRIIRDDGYKPGSAEGHDVPYFRCIHRLEDIPPAVLPEGFELTSVTAEELAEHISECYETEGITAQELERYRQRPVYDADLWIAVRNRDTGRIAASGLGEIDTQTGEGELEWIQVLPEYRRRGFGRYTVCELLSRIRGKADFVTVSGKLNDPNDPEKLYLSCGFCDTVIWHIVRTDMG